MDIMERMGVEPAADGHHEGGVGALKRPMEIMQMARGGAWLVCR